MLEQKSAGAAQHGFEIFVMLFVMLLLGMALSWLLTRPAIRQLRRTTAELQRSREQLSAAERRAQPQPRLRQSSSTQHEQTLTELRATKLELASARARVAELEQVAGIAPSVHGDALEAALSFVKPANGKGGKP